VSLNAALRTTRRREIYHRWLECADLITGACIEDCTFSPPWGRSVEVGWSLKNSRPRQSLTFAADVTRIRRESVAYVTQMLRAKFAYDVRHETAYHANVVRTCRATRDVTFGPLSNIHVVGLRETAKNNF
jgi:hypothetical protein